MARQKWAELGGFVAAVRAGEPVATYLSQQTSLPILIPLSVWLAHQHGNFWWMVLLFSVGLAGYHATWIPHLRHGRPPPEGLPLHAASLISIFIVVLAPETWFQLTGFLIMGFILALAAGARSRAGLQLAGILIAVFLGWRAELVSGISVVIFVSMIPVMASSAVAFVLSEFGWRQRELGDALSTSGATALDTDETGNIRAVLGARIPGVEVGTELAAIVHPEDHRPNDPAPGAIMEYRIRCDEGDWRWLRETVESTARLSTSVRRSGLVDITEKRRLRQETERRASFDQLTALPNRASHVELSADWATAADGYLILIDLDDFKSVNDTLGHSIGDQVLILLARRFEAIEGIDQLARLGGDEFAALVSGEEQALKVAAKLAEVASTPLTIDDMIVSSGASAGIASFEPTTEADEIRRRAGVALRSIKSTDDRIALYDRSLEVQSSRRNELASRLPTALAGNEIVVFHQPKLDLATRQVIGTEALVRWAHPEHGYIAPGEFLDLVTVGGHHRALLDVVMRNALFEIASLADSDRQLTVAVNLDTRNLREPDLVDRVHATLEASGLQPHHLILELTEDALIVDDATVTQSLTELHGSGIRLSIDDFGTGYSSLSYLTRLPVSEVKLDRSLVSQITRSPRDLMVVESVLDLANRLQLSVVAEGIEDAETLECLTTLGCPTGQGYLIGRPTPLDEADWTATASAQERLRA